MAAIGDEERLVRGIGDAVHGDANERGIAVGLEIGCPGQIAGAGLIGRRIRGDQLPGRPVVR